MPTKPKPKQIVITRNLDGSWNVITMNERETLSRKECQYRVDVLTTIEQAMHTLISPRPDRRP